MTRPEAKVAEETERDGRCIECKIGNRDFSCVQKCNERIIRRALREQYGPMLRKIVQLFPANRHGSDCLCLGCMAIAELAVLEKE